MPTWLQAALSGMLAGSALMIGAAAGYIMRIAQRAIAGIMAFGSGVLISALSLALTEEAFRRGGFDSTAVGFLGGAVIYTGANWMLARYGARHCKRSGHQQPSEQQTSGSGLAIAIGSLLDGIPESIVIGLSLLSAGVVSLVAVIAIFLSNIPEGLSSAAGMKNAGRSRLDILGIWSMIAVICGIASLIGHTVCSRFSSEIVAATTAPAAGAILAMLADTMVPQAYAAADDFSGLITVAGFLAAFVLSHLSI